MKEIKDKLDQLKGLFLEIETIMQPYLDELRRKEKQSQLKSVERSIVELQKTNTTIPNELRELKFKLVHEVDLFKEGKALQRELSNMLSPFFTKPKITKTKATLIKTSEVTSPSRKKSYRVTIADLVKSGLIIPGTEIQNKYKGKWYKAVIRQDGIIQMNLNGKLELFSSPSGAAVAASGKSQDGWIWWSLTGSHHAETLDYYRKKYIHEVKGRG